MTNRCPGIDSGTCFNGVSHGKSHTINLSFYFLWESLIKIYSYH